MDLSAPFDKSFLQSLTADESLFGKMFLINWLGDILAVESAHKEGCTRGDDPYRRCQTVGTWRVLKKTTR